MKKRLLGIILAVLLVLPTVLMSGCGEEESVLKLVGPDSNALTLTLYTITDEATTEEARQAVEDEINRITHYEFNTHVILRTFTEDEYVAKLEADLAEDAATYVPADEALEGGDADDTTKAEETEIEETLETKKKGDGDDETRRVIIEEEKAVYPAEDGRQVDIFLVNSLDNYNKYIANGDIQAMDSELIGNSAIINKYVNTTLMQAVSTMTGTYGIPNNRLIGDYEYILLRKDLVDKYNYDPENLNTLTKLQNFINDAKTEGGVTVLDTYGVEPMAVSMTGESSFFGSYVGYNPAQNTNAMPRNVLTNSSFQKEYGMIRTLKAEGTMVEGEMTEDKNPACVLMKGNAAIPQVYGDDYYVSVYKYPTATNENVFNSVYAVSTYTKSLARCMQIITYLQTDEELCNILRYGVKDEHYTLDEETNEITIISDEYKMDPKYAGNQFLTYVNNEMTELEKLVARDDKDVFGKWALAKQQNLDVVGSPYLSFSALTTDVIFEDESSMSEYSMSAEEIMAEVIKASDEAEKKLESFKGTGAELTEYMNTLGKEFGNNAAVKAAISNKYTNSPFARYVAWYKITYGTEETA